ncbi:hypothetical protein G6F70_001485 [Rhizopus microsporus]|nr:hypothetical protein G6F71_000222 [Rhizopus microsporus]KAG1203335.1 hypothetical protein G6F70_001485 [Rhizopus microsporus]KAG1209122.1 hypothetical protein G6F69_006622 [Rhizopus microsporus]KAG1238922.1 hypothetical protein G6F67_000020 [Rhizopus microsporus]KAG1267449.1 hypothetical protein G6F68_001921 [Rhizopus microsporus]
MEQELIELLLFSKKALSTGQTICAQANELCQQSEKCVETIEKIHPKLVFVNNHILVQMATLEKIREYNNLKERESTLQSLTIELTTIFNLLKQRTIDKDILRVNRERDPGTNDMGEQVTLFDYISDEAIIELQRQADDEIGEMEVINNLLENQSKNISLTISELSSLREAAMIIPLDEATTAFSHEKLKIQEDEIAKMADILTSLTNHYDQLGEATRLYHSDPEACGELDITVLEDDHEHIPNILDSLRDSLDVVESIAQIQDRLVKVLYELEYFGTSGQADIICEKIVDAELEIKDRERNLDEFFQQLSSLAEWYRFYASSYNYLLLEIERRRKAQEKQEILRKEMMKALEEAYNDELQERRSWSAQHGQYLPEVLCPFINDLPSKLTVAVESESGRLPNLSPENVEKALAEIHNVL